MARIQSHNATVGLILGATWGTGVQADKKIQVQNFVVNDAYDARIHQNHDSAYSPGNIKRGHRNTTFSFNIDCAFGGEWHLLFAALAGSASVGAEITASQGDYLHTISFAADHSKFLCIPFETETDVVGEITSGKISSATFTGTENGALMLAVQGIGSAHIISGASTDNAELNAITLLDTTAEPMIFNGANAYMRIADYSTGTALDSGDNVPWTSFSLALNRPLTPYWAVRGALSDQTYEPYQSALTSGVLTVTLAHIDDSETDLQARLIAGAKSMIEIFTDGAAIGTGSARSIKLQIPYATILSVSGYGIGGQAALQQPSATFQLGTAPTAPAGMSGVTRVATLASVGTRSTGWLA